MSKSTITKIKLIVDFYNAYCLSKIAPRSVFNIVLDKLLGSCL